MTFQKERHGCLTTWLIIILVVNSLAFLLYLFGAGFIREAAPELPTWVIPVSVVLVLINIVCTIGLFRWQKWGFWGIVVTTVASAVISFSVGFGVGESLRELIAIAVLYAVLNIGDENKGWPQLE